MPTDSRIQLRFDLYDKIQAAKASYDAWPSDEAHAKVMEATTAYNRALMNGEIDN